jgi:hypothetical protein
MNVTYHHEMLLRHGSLAVTKATDVLGYLWVLVFMSTKNRVFLGALVLGLCEIWEYASQRTKVRY